MFRKLAYGMLKMKTVIVNAVVDMAKEENEKEGAIHATNLT